MNGKRFQILSLSGGGVRGLYTISILATIEQILADKHNDANYNIAQHFDLISGTSIGGILALGLASGINARTLKTVIDDNRLKIFPPYIPPRFFKKIRRIIGLAKFSRYKSKALREVLEKTFQDKKINNLNTRVLIPSVNGTTGLPRVFKTAHCPEFICDRNLSLVDVGMATSAAPTYFDPQLINDCLMVDGGLIANSPALIAYHEANHFLGINKENIYLLSIGTMGVQETLNTEHHVDSQWGYVSGWSVGEKLISLTLSANESIHNFMAKHLLEDRFVELNDHNTPSQSESITLDNASDSAASMLRGRGEARAQYAVGDKKVLDFFENIPKTEIEFYKGEI